MKKFLVLGLLLLPTFTFAAGFAKDPIFLSRTPVTEGESVRVYAVISNNDAAAFVGSIIFYDGTTKIGSSQINLAAGATQTASISWTPSAGSHAVNAQIVSQSGTVAEKITANFSISTKQQPVKTATSTVVADNPSITTSGTIQDSIANVSPQVADVTEPAFNAVDNARSSIAGTLDNQISKTKEKLGSTPKVGIVAGDATSLQDAKIENPTSGVWYWVYTVYLYILQALRYLIGNAGVFYPFIAIAFLYFLWRLFARYRRPVWQR